MRVVSSKTAIFASCGHYIFRNVIHKTKIIMSEYMPVSCQAEIDVCILLQSVW